MQNFTESSHATKNFNHLYAEISDSIGNATKDILAINIEHEDGKREIGNITNKLRYIQTRFDSELHQLKTHAEWDTFTLAFFGETNAGKSTIIESLRILFKEESREALLKKNSDDLENFTQTLSAQINDVREGLHAWYSEYTGELAAISQGTARLAKIAQNEAQERNRIAEVEAAARNKLAEQEASARLAAEQQEATKRLQIEKVHAASRFKVRLALFGIGGIMIGATAAVAFLKLAGT